MREAALEWAAERAKKDARHNNQAYVRGGTLISPTSSSTLLYEMMERELAREMFEEYMAIYNFDMGDR